MMADGSRVIPLYWNRSVENLKWSLDFSLDDPQGAAIPGFYQPRRRRRNIPIIILLQCRAPNSDLKYVVIPSSDHTWARCSTWHVRKWPFPYPTAVSELFDGQPWNLAGFYYYLVPREVFRGFSLGWSVGLIKRRDCLFDHCWVPLLSKKETL